MKTARRVGNVTVFLGLCAVVSSAITASVVRTDAAGGGLDSREEAAPRHAVVIHGPSGPPRVAVGRSRDGADVTVACGTCHATRTADRTSTSRADLDEFHQGIDPVHGGTTCVSCHDERDYDRLRLADGRPVEFVDVMVLCSQCHGPERRDYDHGAHGGMTGYWDLTRGPRERNNCVDCHDPHAPAFTVMRPTFKPIDRFLSDDHRESNE